MLRESSLIISALESSKLESASPQVFTNSRGDWDGDPDTNSHGDNSFGKSDDVIDKNKFRSSVSLDNNNHENSNTFGHVGGNSSSGGDVRNNKDGSRRNGLHERRTNRFSLRSDSSDSTSAMFFMAQTSFSGPTQDSTVILNNSDGDDESISKSSRIKNRWPPTSSDADNEENNSRSYRTDGGQFPTTTNGGNLRWSVASPDTEHSRKQSHVDIKLKRTTSSTSSGDEGLRLNNRFARSPSPTLAAVPRGRVSSIKYSFEGTVRKSKSVSNLSTTSKKSSRFNDNQDGFSDDDDDDAFAVSKRPALRSAASFGHINTNNLSPLLNDRRFFQKAISSSSSVASPASSSLNKNSNKAAGTQRAVSFSNISNTQRERELDELIDDYERENFPSTSRSVTAKQGDPFQLLSPPPLESTIATTSSSTSDDFNFPLRDRLGTGEMTRRTKVDVLTNNNETFHVVRHADDSDSDDEARAAAVRRRLGIEDDEPTTTTSLDSSSTPSQASSALNTLV